MAKCKYNFSKDELERVYKEHGSYGKAGKAIGLSKGTFRSQYLISQGRCMSCGELTSEDHLHRLCEICLEKNRVEDKPPIKECEYCQTTIYRKEGQSKLSWSTKKGCDDCLDRLYKASLIETKSRYRYKYNESIRLSPKTKIYQAEYRKSEIGKSKRRSHNAKRRALKITTASPTIAKYLEDLLLNKHLHMCPYCSTIDNLSIDHIVPLCRGGTHTEGNVELVCLDCNIRKGTKTKEEFIEFLKDIKEN